MGEMVTKAAVRKEMKRMLRGISMDERSRQSAAVTRALFQLPAYQNARRVSLFLSMKDEIDTGEILEDVFSSGRSCFIPRYLTGPGSRMEMVLLRDRADYDSLPTTAWNIKQPALQEEREEALADGNGLDLILVPGLAFTVRGERCGRGGGYYDSYLARCAAVPGRKPPITVALAFTQQVMEHVPTDSHDFIIDHVLCP